MMHMDPRFRAAGILAVAAALAFAMPAGGATFVDMDLPQLIAESDAVIEGRVTQVESFWDENGVVIVTEALIAVDDKIAGKSEDWIRVRVPGGEVNGYTIEAPGFPTLAADERVVLFVQRPADGGEALRITGNPLGKYRIVEEGGDQIARPTVDSGAVLVSPDGGRTEAPQALSLDRLKEDIREAVRAYGLDR